MNFARFSSVVTPPARVPAWQVWGAVWGVLLLLLACALLMGGWVLQKVHAQRMQQQWEAQQTVQADLWARTLTTRLEAHQRLLTSIAQGMHSSLLDKPAVLDALMQQDGSMLRLFDSLHVALPQGAISHHGVGAERADLDSLGRDALRRALHDGKPSVTHVQSAEDTQHLRALLVVPMRQPDGRISGALAAVVKLPLASLLPASDGAYSGVQYLLLNADGLVLAHSDAMQRWRNVQEIVGAHAGAWRSLSEPSTANADTRLWGATLASRVGLPLPQWQVLILRDLRAPLTQALPGDVWLAAGAVAWVLAWLGLWLLWALAVRHAGGLYAATLVQPLPALAPEPDPAPRPASGLPSWQQLGSLAMLEAVPSTLLLEQGGWVRLGTPQLLAVLGYSVPLQPSAAEGAHEPLAFAQCLADPQMLQRLRLQLMEVGTFEGPLQMRKKDGDVLRVEALGWSPAQLPEATVWQLRLPWRQRKAMPLPDQQHAWHDHLTRLPNRDAFMWAMQSWVTDSVQAAKAPLVSTHEPSHGCLLFADVDHLGMINESISREMGSQVLRHVARLMASYTQPLGDVARLGGDEFAVLLPGISLAHAQSIGQALCDAVWRWQPTWGGERHWVSLSVGVVAVDAQRHHPDQALRAADMACYEAKRRGRCQVAVGQISAQPALVGLGSS